jgi:DNA end-binding protein Ku
MSRATASGTISFGLVSIPVKLYTATSSEGVSFNLIHKKCNGRIKQQIFCPTDNEVVERSDLVKGYEHAKNQYVLFTEEELDALKAPKTDTIEIVEFVPAATVDWIYIAKTYYLGPDKGGDRAYKLLGEAMERTGKIAVARFFTRGRDELVLLRPYKHGLILHYAYYANEVRSFDDVERGAGPEAKPVESELADKLIEQLAVAEFHPEHYRDQYASRVNEAVEKKVQGQEITVSPEATVAPIIDLFEALKRSLASKEGAEAPHAPSGKPERIEAVPSRPLKKAEPRHRAAKPAAG